MSKTYSNAPDADITVVRMVEHYHDKLGPQGDLDSVTVHCLFVYDEDKPGVQCLKHQGYPAGAVVRITPLRERAMSMADATIVIDRAGWQYLTPRQRNALIDHELTHLERVWVKDDDGNDTDEPKLDPLGRPRLRMRRHDHQYGWFDDVAKRHGEASPEVRQARRLIESTGQLYFEFERAEAA